MSSEPARQPGDGADLSVTQARAGVRRGLSRVLVISTGLGIVALIAAWLLVPHHATPPAASAAPASSQTAAPTG